MTEELIDPPILLVRGRCCRDWPIVVGVKTGTCGYCGQVPEIVGEWGDDAG
jgi:hypothetical protein